MSDLLSQATPIKARHIRPGQGQAVEVKSGQYLQIQTLQGKQVADFVAFRRNDPAEYLSTSVTRSSNANIVPGKGMTLFSNRRQGMFEIVEDTVGRHDMLYACCDPIRYEQLGAPGHANCREALTEALSGYGIDYDRVPTPINWFMNVAILQRGELEIREPLAEKGDFVLLRALEDVVAAVSACPQDLTATNGFAPTELRIRVFPTGAIPALANDAEESTGPDESKTAEIEAAAIALEAEPAPARDEASQRAARRAGRRAARRAAATEDDKTASASAESASAGTDAEAIAEPEGSEAPFAEASGAQDDPPGPARVASGTPRPARLGDTAEATVVRGE